MPAPDRINVKLGNGRRLALTRAAAAAFRA
jgi:hypothetical protein